MHSNWQLISGAGSATSNSEGVFVVYACSAFKLLSPCFGRLGLLCAWSSPQACLWSIF
jgi:hypothetical protein